MYLEIDEGFVNHPKTLRLCSMMKDTQASAYVLKLWSWAIRAAPDGDLRELSAAEVEMASCYAVLDGKLCEALVIAKFLDQCESGGFMLHNWMERMGKKLKEWKDYKQKDRDRKRVSRTSDGSPSEVHRKSDGEKSDSNRIQDKTETRQRQDKDKDSLSVRKVDQKIPRDVRDAWRGLWEAWNGKVPKDRRESFEKLMEMVVQHPVDLELFSMAVERRLTRFDQDLSEDKVKYFPALRNYLTKDTWLEDSVPEEPKKSVEELQRESAHMY